MIERVMNLPIYTLTRGSLSALITASAGILIISLLYFAWTFAEDVYDAVNPEEVVDINNIESVDVQNIRKNNLPTFTWTINNDEKLKLSQKFADNCIFENLLI